MKGDDFLSVKVFGVTKGSFAEKAKIKKEHIQTHKIFHSKGNQKQNEKQSTEWEKTFANGVTNKGFISKI